jgi:hypothetical protein
VFNLLIEMVFPSKISFVFCYNLRLAGGLIDNLPLASLNPTTLQFVFLLISNSGIDRFKNFSGKASIENSSKLGL